MLQGAISEGRLSLINDLVDELLSSPEGTQSLSVGSFLGSLSAPTAPQVLKVLAQCLPGFEANLLDPVEHLRPLRNGTTDFLKLFLEKGGKLDQIQGGPEELFRSCLRSKSSQPLPSVRFLVERGVSLQSLSISTIFEAPDDVLDFLYSKDPAHFNSKRLLNESLNLPRAANPDAIPFSRFLCWCCRRLMKETSSPSCWLPPLPADLPPGQLLTTAFFVPFVELTPGNKAALLAQIQKDYAIHLHHQSWLITSLVQRGILPEKDYILELLCCLKPTLALRGLRKGRMRCALSPALFNFIIFLIFLIFRSSTSFLPSSLADLVSIDDSLLSDLLDRLLDLQLPTPAHFRGPPMTIEVLASFVLRRLSNDLGYLLPFELVLRHPRFLTQSSDGLLQSYIVSQPRLDPRILPTLINLNRPSKLLTCALGATFQPPNPLSGEELLKLAMEKDRLDAIHAIIKHFTTLDVAPFWEYYKALSSREKMRAHALAGTFELLMKQGRPFLVVLPRHPVGAVIPLNLLDSAHVTEALLSLHKADAGTAVGLFMNPKGPNKYPDRRNHAQGILDELQRLETAQTALNKQQFEKIQELRNIISFSLAMNPGSHLAVSAPSSSSYSSYPSFSFSSSPSFSSLTLRSNADPNASSRHGSVHLNPITSAVSGVSALHASSALSFPSPSFSFPSLAQTSSSTPVFSFSASTSLSPSSSQSGSSSYSIVSSATQSTPSSSSSPSVSFSFSSLPLQSPPQSSSSNAPASSPSTTSFSLSSPQATSSSSPPSFSFPPATSSSPSSSPSSAFPSTTSWSAYTSSTSSSFE